MANDGEEPKWGARPHACDSRAATLQRAMSFFTRVLVALLPCLAAGQVNVLTANYNTHRTSANLSEKILTTARVSSKRFGKLGVLPVDGQIYAQPLYLSGYDSGDGVKRDLLFAATMTNSVYAFDVTKGLPGTLLWSTNLGNPLPSASVNLPEIRPDIGILSTPVIDLARSVLFAVAATQEAGLPVYRLHALALADGHESVNGPVRMVASTPGIGDGSENGLVALDPAQHLQRPGLLLLDDKVYAGFGSVHDRYPFHGWILAYSATDLQQNPIVFNVTPNGGGGGVWQSGRGLAAADGNIYAAIGNGDYDGLVNFGESFLKLTPELAVVDWFAPANWQTLSDTDQDLGSQGPILLPSSKLLIGGDKSSDLYLVKTDSMGHLGLSGDASPQIFPALAGGGFFNMAVWDCSPSPWLYAVEPGNYTEAFSITAGTFETTPVSRTEVTSDYPWQGIALSAHQCDPGSGILWLTAGDHTTAGVPGTLYAFDAANLTRLLWSSEMNADRDRLGGFAKFATPTVANGRVYVPTFSNEVAVYGLIP